MRLTVSPEPAMVVAFAARLATRTGLVQEPLVPVKANVAFDGAAYLAYSTPSTSERAPGERVVLYTYTAATCGGGSFYQRHGHTRFSTSRKKSVHGLTPTCPYPSVAQSVMVLAMGFEPRGPLVSMQVACACYW